MTIDFCTYVIESVSFVWYVRACVCVCETDGSGECHFERVHFVSLNEMNIMVMF